MLPDRRGSEADFMREWEQATPYEAYANSPETRQAIFRRLVELDAMDGVTFLN